MAEAYQTSDHHQISGKTVVLTTLAGVVIGGPLLALMGFCFLATGALFLITSPLLLIFSPLLLGAGFVFVAAVAGFGVATVMATAALFSFRWVLRSYGGPRLVGLYGGPRLVGLESDGLIQDVDKAKESGKDWAGYLQQTVQNPHENLPNRG